VPALLRDEQKTENAEKDLVPGCAAGHGAVRLHADRLAIDEDFPTLTRRFQAEKAQFAQRQQNLLEERTTSLTGRTGPTPRARAPTFSKAAAVRISWRSSSGSSDSCYTCLKSSNHRGQLPRYANAQTIVGILPII
jgi:hypothetical protein